MRAAFEAVYADRTWHGGSGPGSDEGATKRWRKFLRAYMTIYKVRSVLDLGCGDWQHSRLIDWTGIDYLGIDVVPAVVEANAERYARPGVAFECADVTTCDLPAADLIICKEVLQHWPLADIERFWYRRSVAARTLIVNDYLPLVENPDIEPGGYRPLDFTAPPFNWPVRQVCDWYLQYPDGSREHKVVHEL